MSESNGLRVLLGQRLTCVNAELKEEIESKEKYINLLVNSKSTRPETPSTV